jgi:hypothetical protein
MGLCVTFFVEIFVFNIFAPCCSRVDAILRLQRYLHTHDISRLKISFLADFFRAGMRLADDSGAIPACTLSESAVWNIAVDELSRLLFRSACPVEHLSDFFMELVK